MKELKKILVRLAAALGFFGIWILGGAVIAAFFGPMGLIGQALWLYVALRISRSLKEGLFDD